MEKVNFVKLREATFPQNAANIRNILPGQAVFNGLIVVKLKRDLKYRGHIYFKPVCPHIVYQEHTYLKSHYKFNDDISIAKSLLSEDMFMSSDTFEIQGQSKCVTEKNVSDAKKMTENINRACFR